MQLQPTRADIKAFGIEIDYVIQKPLGQSFLEVIVQLHGR